jgi:hypothetical protein
MRSIPTGFVAPREPEIHGPLNEVGGPVCQRGKGVPVNMVFLAFVKRD